MPSNLSFEASVNTWMVEPTVTNHVSRQAVVFDIELRVQMRSMCILVCDGSPRALGATDGPVFIRGFTRGLMRCIVTRIRGFMVVHANLAFTVIPVVVDIIFTSVTTIY
ncbi:hypothetical protein FRX31_031685 [Thalictrum thalictroides]|uniref:Uncharacterized protein n=1 Tax=Thalictrum thalictroides TaxID=46969 RepID=A0A7J6V1N7_THATH|nr:hypothetical protein FRX31_031685 [Thalictrum thalictroides]